jgi:hypothetical protein
VEDNLLYQFFVGQIMPTGVYNGKNAENLSDGQEMQVS